MFNETCLLCCRYFIVLTVRTTRVFSLDGYNIRVSISLIYSVIKLKIHDLQVSLYSRKVAREFRCINHHLSRSALSGLTNRQSRVPKLEAYN
jgi:hypothetical protein